MNTLKWGILGTSHFAQKAILPALQNSRHNVIHAIASRNPEKAKTVSEQFSIPKHYADYNALLTDPDIDVIYNPLPNDLHVPWTLKSLESGKHVLCEKPMGLNADEVQSLATKSKNFPDLKVMEAFMYKFHPRWQWVKSEVRKETIGTVRAIQTVFSYNNRDPEDIRNQSQMGGGGLYDIGCYAISSARFILEEEPVRVLGTFETDPEFHIDRLMSGIARFQNCQLTFICGTQMKLWQHTTIIGTEGAIEIPMPFTPPKKKSAEVHIQSPEKNETVRFDPVDQYVLECDAFAESVLHRKPVPCTLSDAIHNMKVIDAMFTSDKNNTWSKP